MNVGVGVGVSVNVAVGVGVSVGVAVQIRNGHAVGVQVGVKVQVGGTEAVGVRVDVGVAVSMGCAARPSELSTVDPTATTMRAPANRKINFNHVGVCVRPPRRGVDRREGAGPV